MNCTADSSELFLGTHLRATGKRTPRVPVSYLHKKGDRESSIAPTKLFRKSDVVANEDDARVAALALAEASQLGDSPKVSLKPYRKKEPNKTSSVGSWEKVLFHSYNFLPVIVLMPVLFFCALDLDDLFPLHVTSPTFMMLQFMKIG